MCLACNTWKKFPRHVAIIQVLKLPLVRCCDCLVPVELLSQTKVFINRKRIKLYGALVIAFYAFRYFSIVVFPNYSSSSIIWSAHIERLALIQCFYQSSFAEYWPPNRIDFSTFGQQLGIAILFHEYPRKGEICAHDSCVKKLWWEEMPFIRG
jgi:hypothetical protein